MADFCKQCSEATFGIDTEDLKTSEVPFAEGYGIREICEGCGPTMVDAAGACLGSCLNNTHTQGKNETTTTK